MASEFETLKKKRNPAKAESTPIKSKEHIFTAPKPKVGRPKRQEPSPKVPKKVEVKEGKPVSKTTTKVKIVSDTESENLVPKQLLILKPKKEKNIQVPAPQQPVAKKPKTGRKVKTLAVKETSFNELEAENLVKGGAKPKSDIKPSKLIQTLISTPIFTSKNDKVICKENSTEFEQKPLSNIKDITKWASKYKEGLLIKEKSFIPQQVSLSSKVQTKLLKQGLPTSDKNILESLDDFLFGDKRQLSVDDGLDVSTLWLILSWRYLRGTFKPSVLNLVKNNKDETVRKATKEVYHAVKKALYDFHKTKKADDVFCIKFKGEINAWVASLTKISGLSGVTATALLSMITKEIPYMSEEGLVASLGTSKGAHKDATLMAYLEYVGSTVKKFGGNLSPRDIEAAWYYQSFKL